jgi:hypothetical protein
MFILGQEEDTMEDTTVDIMAGVVALEQRDPIKIDILPDSCATSLYLTEQFFLQDKALSKSGESEMRVLLRGLKEHD